MAFGQVIADWADAPRMLPASAASPSDDEVVGIALGERLAETLREALACVAMQLRVMEARAASPAALGGARVILVGQVMAMSHHDLIASIRRSAPAASVLLVAEPGDDFATVLGLELGADAFVRADEGCRVLMSQVRAMLRQSARLRACVAGERGNRLQIGRALLDHPGRSVLVNGVNHALPVAQFAVLWELVRQAGRVVRRDELSDLLHDVSGHRYPRQVDTVVCRLRERLDGLRCGLQVRAVRGSGYLLSALPQ
ncbi:MAG: response regulator transcription factor [Betaproteobacteria bacterium]|nr:response regulator transcription factor [Betaproteobacteria bacterium]